MRNNERTACIVFDFDGVLIDSNTTKRQAYYEALADIPGSADAITEVLAASVLEPVDRYQTIARIVSLLRDRELVRASDVAGLAADLADRYTNICDRALRRCNELPGASTLLARLSTAYPLYVNSATPEPILRAMVARRDWTTYFRDVLGSPATKEANLKRIAAREAIEMRQLLFVGDSEADRRAALQAGCHFVGVVIERGRFRGPLERYVTDLGVLLSMI